jgi:hypothetical protein
MIFGNLPHPESGLIIKIIFLIFLTLIIYILNGN